MRHAPSPHPYFHRVQRFGRPRPAPPLPKGRYREQTFIDTDGTEYAVVSGILETPLWPEGMDTSRDPMTPARLYLPKPK